MKLVSAILFLLTLISVHADTLNVTNYSAIGDYTNIIVTCTSNSASIATVPALAHLVADLFG